MENRRNCPACGAALQGTEEKCPVCGLAGVNRRFLSRAGYEKWVQEVLEPHKAAIAPKVFAGNGYGLILTGWGDLYGIGENKNHEITDADQPHYDQPVLIAEDVVSAAACSSITAYVTRDGRLHWQYDRKENDWLPVLSGIREVYAEDWRPRFWMVKNSGEIICFGENLDELLEKRTRKLAFEFPEVTGLNHSFGLYTHWSDTDTSSMSEEEHFKESKEYRDLIWQHGVSNVELELNEMEPNKAVKAVYFAFRTDMRVFKPRLYVVNRFLFDPVPFRKKWQKDLPHRYYSRPLLDEEYCGSIAQASGAKKVCGPGGTHRWLALQADGRIEISNVGSLDWLKTPVRDLAWGIDMIILACANGEILWCDSEMFGEDVVNKLQTGSVNTCRLPEEE